MAPSTTKTVLKTVAFYALIAILGVACFVGPTWAAGTPLMPAPLFPLLRTGVERLTWIPFALLAMLGFVSAGATRHNPFFIGIASMSLFPCAAIAELIVDNTTHNLIPLELIMYGMFSIPATLGAIVGHFLVKARTRKSKTTK